MNHMPLRTLSGVAQVRRPTQRALAKQRTREKILASAKTLFTQKGYERATIRDIASEAGMSTGAVFASFTDKSDLFNEIIAADREAVLGVMLSATQHTGCESRKAAAPILLAMFTAGYAYHLNDLPLLQATVSVSWSPELGGQVRDRLERQPVTALVAEVLSAAIQRGELPPGADVSLLSQMLWDSYLTNFRHAAFDGWKLEDLTARAARQIDVILAGARAS
jgi:AcrR family transcriptional regulator